MASEKTNNSLQSDEESEVVAQTEGSISLKSKADPIFGCSELRSEISKVESNLKPNVDNKASDNSDEADPVLYEILTEMGMDRNLAKVALICTGNKSVDVALAWIGELGAEEMDVYCSKNESNESETDSDRSSNWEDCEEDEVYYKMVFVVNTEYGMGVGKIASQVGHAALGLYRLLKEDPRKYRKSLECWEETGEKKIALRGKDVDELLRLQIKAKVKDLPFYLIEDAGHTQIPEGAITVLGIFGEEEAVNEVTGHLKLL